MHEKFTDFSENIKKKVLRELCSEARQRVWEIDPSKVFIVDGNTLVHSKVKKEKQELQSNLVDQPNHKDQPNQMNLQSQTNSKYQTQANNSVEISSYQPLNVRRSLNGQEIRSILGVEVIISEEAEKKQVTQTQFNLDDDETQMYDGDDFNSNL